MPREARAVYRRTFQVKPYESETIELSVADEIPDGVNLIEAVKVLYAELALAADAVVIERMDSAPERPVDARSLSESRGRDPWAG